MTIGNVIILETWLSLTSPVDQKPVAITPAVHAFWVR
jgi:hypothetical protein